MQRMMSIKEIVKTSRIFKQENGLLNLIFLHLQQKINRKTQKSNNNFTSSILRILNIYKCSTISFLKFLTFKIFEIVFLYKIYSPHFMELSPPINLFTIP